VRIDPLPGVAGRVSPSTVSELAGTVAAVALASGDPHRTHACAPSWFS
jgi:hypothetical protein